ncbi:hypothetical protein GCM10029964_039690 [Kibdelosporangium lantanae]
MEIISVGWGVRAAILHVTRTRTPLKFTLYPMVHLGEARYYEEMSRRLRAHDLIVAEGVVSTDKRGRAVTLAYELPAGGERLGLVAQPWGMVDVGVPVVWADMPGEEFSRRWQALPLVERAAINTGAPLFGLYLRLFMSRERLARSLELNDDTIVDNWRPETGVDRLITDDRDALLVEAVTRIHEERRDEPVDVAVVYGAEHVPPLVTYLMKAFGYVVTDSDWITVFDY